MPVGDTSAWSHDPWHGEIARGRLYGRGAADVKAGVAAALHATKSILRAGCRPPGDVWFHLVTDEEVVGYDLPRHGLPPRFRPGPLAT